MNGTYRSNCLALKKELLALLENNSALRYASLNKRGRVVLSNSDSTRNRYNPLPGEEGGPELVEAGEIRMCLLIVCDGEQLQLSISYRNKSSSKADMRIFKELIVERAIKELVNQARAHYRFSFSGVYKNKLGIIGFLPGKERVI